MKTTQQELTVVVALVPVPGKLMLAGTAAPLLTR